MSFLFTLILQAQNSSNLPFLITMGGVMIIFYFFMIRPQQQKQKQIQEFIKEVNKGDEIVTTGGIHGKVHAVDELTFTILVDKSTKITIDKASISMDASKRVQAKTSES